MADLLLVPSPSLLTLPKSHVGSQTSQHVRALLDGTDLALAEVAVMALAQEKLVGSRALRSCSPLRAPQHLGVSGRDTMYYCLLSTSKVSMMVASQCSGRAAASALSPAPRAEPWRKTKRSVLSSCVSSAGGKQSAHRRMQAVGQ